jgi:hypothetical protein
MSVTEIHSFSLIMKFNSELTDRIKLYSLTITGEEISNETAEEYLNALADFYEAFSGIVQNKK